MTKMYIDYAVIKQALKALENDVLRNAENRGRQIAVAMSRIGQLEAQRDALLQALKALVQNEGLDAYAYLDKGIGTATAAGQRWLNARAVIALFDGPVSGVEKIK